MSDENTGFYDSLVRFALDNLNKENGGDKKLEEFYGEKRKKRFMG